MTRFEIKTGKTKSEMKNSYEMVQKQNESRFFCCCSLCCCCFTFILDVFLFTLFLTSFFVLKSVFLSSFIHEFLCWIMLMSWRNYSQFLKISRNSSFAHDLLFCLHFCVLKVKIMSNEAFVYTKKFSIHWGSKKVTGWI